ncbi:hypothetical protein [Sinomonas halotolerans]|uniref:ESX secretion-associated protein EspG n=1 Tax=Sinomonas halotolerans TaxID=1644133 RepID=A0ABU9WX47_9MICC
MTQAQITWTERDIRCAATVLDSAADDGHELPTLTDEEILALDGPAREQLVELPWIASEGVEREAAAAVALRGLLVKGIAYPVHAEGDPSPRRLEAAVEHTGALTLRRTSERLVRLERQVSTGRRWIYAYVHDGGVLAEEIDESGLHTFRVFTPAGIGPWLARFVDPEDAAAADGDPVLLDQAQFEEQAGERLADTRAATTVSALAAHGPDRSLSIYTSSTGVAVLTPLGAEGATDPADAVELRDVSGPTLAGLLADLTAGIGA